MFSNFILFAYISNEQAKQTATKNENFIFSSEKFVLDWGLTHF